MHGKDLPKTPFRELFAHPFLGRGFRPFFFLGALYSVISLFIWAGFYAGYITPPAVFSDPVSWHAHEMIYGFSTAIVAGFLLTAVANWTGGAPARQMHLAGLCLVWLAGRLVMNFDLGLSLLARLVLEGAFIPLLAISLAIPLFKSWNRRNFIFLALLSILFFCDLVFLITEGRKALYIAVMVIITMISLIGGRIIPAFTVAALRRRGEKAYQTPQNKLDMFALASLALVTLALCFTGPQGRILALFSFVSALIHLWRMRHYHTGKALRDPMVWILHAGYIWVVIGLLLTGAAALGFLPFSAALHALTAGAIGSMTLGMMCRVALGHTGRALVAGRAARLAFVLMPLAGALRVFGPAVWPSYDAVWIIGSSALWAVCFGLYILIYTPILWTARPDKKPA